MPAKKTATKTSKTTSKTTSKKTPTKADSVSVASVADTATLHDYQDCGFDEWSAVILTRSIRIATSKEYEGCILARVVPGSGPTAKASSFYLKEIPVKYRQQHNCRTCKDFIDAYADVVVCKPDGTIDPLLFSALDRGSVPAFYKAAHTALVKRLVVLLGGIHTLQPFYADVTTLGCARNVDKHGVEWTHFSAIVDKKFTKKHSRRSLRSDADTLASALEDYAHSSAVGWVYDRSNTLGLLPTQKHMIEVFKELCDMYKASITAAHREAVILCAAAQHQDVSHIRSSVLGPVMDRVKEGQSPEQIISFIRSVNDPMKHMRPTTVTEGNIKRADKLIEELGLESAFKRRIATVAELKKESRLLWYPEDKKESTAASHKEPTGFASRTISLSSSRRTKSPSAPQDGGSMTWACFVANVLPRTRAMEVTLRSSESYGGITAAVDKKSAPLFYWDSAENRNPYAWFVTNPPGAPSSANLGIRGRVVGICSIPCVWTGGYEQHDGAILLLEGAKPPPRMSLAIFPACLRSELREIRSSVERISANGLLQSTPGNAAYGLWLQPRESNGRALAQVIVEYSGGLRQTITIDRWM